MSMILTPPDLGGPTPALGDSGASAGAASSSALAAPSGFTLGQAVSAVTAAGVVPGNSNTGTPFSSTSAWNKVLTWLGVPGVSDVIGMVLGLLLVAAGLFMFKPVRETAATAARAAVVA